MPPSLASRYRNVPLVVVDGRTSLGQRAPTTDPIPQDSIIHTVIGHETLDMLAYKYYGREDLWWRIADANRGADPVALAQGQTLAIPPLRTATRTSRR